MYDPYKTKSQDWEVELLSKRLDSNRTFSYLMQDCVVSNRLHTSKMFFCILTNIDSCRYLWEAWNMAWHQFLQHVEMCMFLSSLLCGKMLSGFHTGVMKSFLNLQSKLQGLWKPFLLIQMWWGLLPKLNVDLSKTPLSCCNIFLPRWSWTKSFGKEVQDWALLMGLQNSVWFRFIMIDLRGDLHLTDIASAWVTVLKQWFRKPFKISLLWQTCLLICWGAK